MNEREKTIRLWFDMWLNQQDMGIDDIFTEDVIYTESWSPQYNNRKTVKHWTEDNRIKSLKEFGCNRNTYDPYQEGDTPQFRAEKANWF